MVKKRSGAMLNRPWQFVDGWWSLARAARERLGWRSAAGSSGDDATRSVRARSAQRGRSASAKKARGRRRWCRCSAPSRIYGMSLDDRARAGALSRRGGDERARRAPTCGRARRGCARCCSIARGRRRRRSKAARASSGLLDVVLGGGAVRQRRAQRARDGVRAGEAARRADRSQRALRRQGARRSAGG